ncbi:hypothetical protein GCM10010276_21190 [Streptomyces longisporus]|uniref:Uncharacterized protein n=1 Tax=Streptomyces longisporus TaxID=1948 RepID=A0ABP5YM39_STRLO
MGGALIDRYLATTQREATAARVCLDRLPQECDVKALLDRGDTIMAGAPSRPT